MIEVEKKFALSDDERERLLSGAAFDREKEFTDIYYDTQEFDLARRDWWMRFRDGKAELKIPDSKNDWSGVEQYHEIIDEREIARHLGIDAQPPLAAALAQAGYAAFASVTTRRTTYRDGDFRIDLDDARFDDGLSCSLAEIELLVERPEQSQLAVQRILDYAASKELTDRPVLGKGLTYFRKHHPDIYGQLCKIFSIAP